MNWDLKVNSLLQGLAHSGGSLLEDLVGCTENDITVLEESFGHQLPGAFLALLRRCGRSWGDLMRGEDSTFPEMLEYREFAKLLLESLVEEMQVDLSADVDVDELPVTIPRGAFGLALDDRDFVFLVHQGYQFFFFRVGDSEDPPVFHYNHDDPGFNRVCDTFTAWLDICIREEIALRAGRLS